MQQILKEEKIEERPKFSFDTNEEMLWSFMKMTTDEIFNHFKNNSKEWRHPYCKRDFGSLFIPGGRKDRVLLVAHVDTVWNDSPHIQLEYEDGIFFSANRYNGLNKEKLPVSYGIGIGADDRAGIAALWKLKDLGHSLLLTGLEEKGCIGSMYLVGNPIYKEMLKEHQFAVQFDRRGKNDAVFYNVATEEFIKYVINQTKYKEEEGSFSDIGMLCEEYCGVNLSIGYRNEHSIYETLFVDWWENTVEVAERWLSKSNLPKFELK